ncbi:hypothetical protein CNYM01_10878 [Colletotrichum nymphaeae SA-01]|uniref:Uncharacterized protein n=1 Tax=Colletotrichum nymphaeae SA-01 TaxID=1460502 RepID=A0A135S6J0_9PEZI|nr:hypothetical protein CNYM01_10878 [Colletotrichum nymphaeae SA-01]
MILSNLSTAIVSVAISTLSPPSSLLLDLCSPTPQVAQLLQTLHGNSSTWTFLNSWLGHHSIFFLRAESSTGQKYPQSDAIATFRHFAFLSPSCRCADLRYRFPTLATNTCGISSLPLHCARIPTLVPRHRPYLETPAHCGTSHRLPSPIAPYLASVHGSTDPTYDSRCLSEPVARLRFVAPHHTVTPSAASTSSCLAPFALCEVTSFPSSHRPLRRNHGHWSYPKTSDCDQRTSSSASLEAGRSHYLRFIHLAGPC